MLEAPFPFSPRILTVSVFAMLLALTKSGINKARSQKKATGENRGKYELVFGWLDCRSG